MDFDRRHQTIHAPLVKCGVDRLRKLIAHVAFLLGAMASSAVGRVHVSVGSAASFVL